MAASGASAIHTPEDLYYSTDHLWIRPDGARVWIGVTDFAQDSMGEIVFVDVPESGALVRAGAAFCWIESTKAVTDLLAPLSGTIETGNAELRKSPEWVNRDPYGRGWLCALVPERGSGGELLDAERYAQLIEAIR